jgi:L-cysteine S-thiosulfotransferase
MKGVAARYPAFDQALGRPVNLEQRVNLCRVRHQQATPLPYESRDLLALTVYVAKIARRRHRGQRQSATPTIRCKGA